MTLRNFDACLPWTLAYEGGWSDDPRDPGGATMCGITQRVYDDDRDTRGLPRQSVRLSTEVERAGIYRRRYWNRVSGNDLPGGVDYAAFDYAVNSGVGRAVRALQHIVGAAEDGDAGPDTLAHVGHYVVRYGATALTDALCQARMAFLRGLPTFRTFGRGWTARVMGREEGAQVHDTGVIDRAFVLAGGGTPAAPALALATAKTWRATA